MPLPWKKSKSKSGRISRFVSDLQQSPKHGGSLVVETGFPTSLIDLFVKNRDRLKKSSSKRTNKSQPNPPLRLVSSQPPPKIDPPSVTEDSSSSKIEEIFDGGLIPANRNDGDDDGGSCVNRGRGGCVLMVVVIKVFVVAVLALSTKKLAVGITLSAFTLLFLELAVARVLTLLNICPNAQYWVDSLIGKLIGKSHQEKMEESSSTQETRNNVSSEIIEESSEEITVPQSETKSSSEDSSARLKHVAEEKEVQTIRDVVFKNEKSKSSKLKSKIVKKLRSYRKKKKMMKIKEKEEAVEIAEKGEEEEESVTEVSSLFSEEIIESEISERDDIGSNPPLLESCGEIEEEKNGTKGDLTKAMVLTVIVLTGLLSGKVLAICLTISCCLILRILRVFCCKSQTSL